MIYCYTLFSESTKTSPKALYVEKNMAYLDSYTIRQGKITLYRRDSEGSNHQSKSWYAKFKIPGERPIRRSLKVTDQNEAEILAENLYFDLVQKSQRGLSLNSKRFSLVAKSYLSDFEEKVEREKDLPRKDQTYKKSRLKQKKLIINKYLIPYFGEKALQDISDFDIEHYKEDRKTYWISGEGSKQDEISYLRNGRKVSRKKLPREKKEPNYGTINKELTTIRQVLEFARMKKLIQGQEIPTIKNVRRPKNSSGRKPGLTVEQVQHLTKTLHARYKADTNPKHKRHHKLLLHYIAFMCLTGIRVAEAKNLTFSDCSIQEKDGAQYLKIYVHGKGLARELIGLDESIIVLEKLRILHLENAKIHDWKFDNNMPLFINQYGKKVGSFANGLNRAFEEAELLYDAHGTKRSAGAFRKYYITQALLIGKVNYFELAKQCGNSVSVIESYYSEIDVTHTPERFIFKNALTGIYDEEINTRMVVISSLDDKKSKKGNKTIEGPK